VPLSVIAADVGTSSRALMKCCEKNDISMLIIRSTNDRQAFVLKENTQQLLLYWIALGRTIKKGPSEFQHGLAEQTFALRTSTGKAAKR